MKKSDVIKRIISVVGEDNVKINEPMSRHTSFKVGGPADIFVTPGSDLEIRDVLKIFRDNGFPVYVMGNGTNLIVRDKGIRGAVLKIYDRFNAISIHGDTLSADAGALLSCVSKQALEAGLKGIEFACGIPGTVGGAIAMNAGAYNGEIKDVVYSVDAIDNDFNIITISGPKLEFGYRISTISKYGYTALRARFKLGHGNYEDIKDRMETLTRRRKEKQPLNLPSAGSTFKRPEGHFAAKLIEDSNLKGVSVGGAEVSKMHSGFIVNNGNASASDILELINIVIDEVYKKFNVRLEPEVKIIGEE
ncbi:MAG: UDP-N-acetylmuramate dehydrogenase [Clostridiales bacterium]|nr:UDP-N-acetylmuramate dehydrogenase [Clostridiales bacterium]HBM81899.1 hypothetical protein [Clostridiaceae bacterium]